MKNNGNIDFAKNSIHLLILGTYLKRNENFFNFEDFSGDL